MSWWGVIFFIFFVQFPLHILFQTVPLVSDFSGKACSADFVCFACVFGLRLPSFVNGSTQVDVLKFVFEKSSYPAVDSLKFVLLI